MMIRIYEPGDKLIILTDESGPVVWEVAADGTPVAASTTGWVSLRDAMRANREQSS